MNQARNSLIAVAVAMLTTVHRSPSGGDARAARTNRHRGKPESGARARSRR